MSTFSSTRLKILSLALPVTLLLGACDNPAPGEGMPKPLAEGPLPKVVPVSEALSSPVLTAIDPSPLNQAEADKVLPPNSRCSFSYTAESPPVLIASLVPNTQQAKGVVKLHGFLVEVNSQAVQGVKSLAQGATFVADGLRVKVEPEGDETGDRRVANMEFELSQSGLLIGYRGWYSCSGLH